MWEIMMRYIPRDDVAGRLRQGASVEQLLPARRENGHVVIRIVRIDREKSGGYLAAVFESFGEGSEDFLDVYEFSAVDPDFPYGRTRVFSDPQEAIDFTYNEFGATPDRFVGAGMIQDEYRDALVDR